jgi:hypothetical protein
MTFENDGLSVIYGYCVLQGVLTMFSHIYNALKDRY